MSDHLVHHAHQVVELALGYEPYAFMLSFDDPQLYPSAIKAAGCALICQIEYTESVKAAGADIIVAQAT